ncbi:F-box protein At5g07610-like [Camellia sinensis]|uniref:F-box protein At5g07610-like n=1 Tax=Camellia sinensis TaxID=4442 RepID=UPI00103557ED|nr:F-box protein At5g07610-like [Camellia sinensis]
MTNTTTSKSIASSSSAIANNVDLLTEILIRVSPKSLLRFKSVSKNWLNLISNSNFAFNHALRNRNSSISGLYFTSLDSCSAKEQVKSVSLQGHQNLPTLAFLDHGAGSEFPIRIQSSCNGLLLCDCVQIVWDCNRTVVDRITMSYIICNPTTQKYKLLPQPCGCVSGSYGCLAFDPSKSPHYKVLLVFNSTNKFEIYSSESSSWKQIDFSKAESFSGGVYWNGAIHWLTEEENVHTRFDFDTEKLIEIPIAPKPKILSLDKIRYCEGCCGRLLLIQMPLFCSMEFEILEMDRDYRGWIVNCNVDLASLINELPGIVQRTDCYAFHVASVVKGENGDDFELVLVFQEPRKVVCYNVKCKTMKVVIDSVTADFDKFICDHGPYGPFRFIESLSSL